MIKSKFSLWVLLPVTLTVLSSGLLYIIFKLVLKPPMENPPTAVYVFTGIFVFTWIWLVFGELRTKAIFIKIDNNTLKAKGFLGLGYAKQYSFNEFDGISTSILPSRWGTYEFLYLIKDNKKVIKISEYYHKNYFEMKQSLISQCKYLGEKRFNFFVEIKEIFQ
jgi:hypothetical protein